MSLVSPAFLVHADSEHYGSPLFLLAISAVLSSAGPHPRQNFLLAFCFWIAVIHVLAFPGLIPDEELAPVKDLCVHMFGGTLLFGCQQHSQEVPTLTGQTSFAGQSLGLNSPAHWVLKNQSALSNFSKLSFSGVFMV